MKPTLTQTSEQKKGAFDLNPKVTVVMPVYNSEQYLREAIDSVLGQTFPHFELLIINDGSKDGSAAIVRSYTDPRIRFLDNQINQGIPKTRNLGLNEAKGDYLAWCDSDDLLPPTRLEEQVQFMEQNQEYGACGSWIERFGSSSDYIWKAERDPEYLKAMLLFRPSLPNATVMLRMAWVRKANLQYDPELPIAEDYDFILKCSQQFPITNIPKTLYLYRASETSIMKSFESQEEKSYAIHKIVYQRALSVLGLAPSEEELRTHWLINSEKILAGKDDLIRCQNWLHFLREKNKTEGTFQTRSFQKVLAERYLFASKKASGYGLRTLLQYVSGATRYFGLANPKDIAKLTLRCLLRKKEF